MSKWKKQWQMVYITSDEDDSSEEEPIKKQKVNEEIPAKEEPSVRLHYDLNINGVKVEMPVRPYPCQEAVIKAIINGCKTEQHCLLESPTGSGKTLALLCGSLAWQCDYEKKLMEDHDKKRKEAETAPDKFGPSASKKTCEEEAANMSTDFDLDGLDWSDDGFSNSECAPKPYPTIYYGSRTHRQIDQVVRELRKTCYGFKNMTILSSREFTCIQDTDRDKTQLCNELLDPSKKCGCPYYKEDSKMSLGSYSGLAAHGISNPWDIEDLTTAGKDLGLCPYFAARNLMSDADIIFCPYNYIIDPAIRESMQIKLNGSIIILDEAHNIEDICRACGSVSLPEDELEKLIQECENTIQLAIKHKHSHEIACIRVIDSIADKLLTFVSTTQLKQLQNIETLSSDQWTGHEFVNVLDISKAATLSEIESFIRAGRDAVGMVNMAKELLRIGKQGPPTLSNEVIRIVEKIMTGFKMITSPKYADDYRVIVMQIPHGYKKEKSLEFMCMNPGVIFAPISEMARTVVLASGTLSPMRSYQGELGVKFPYTIQANHVTPQEQVFVKCVSKGPAGISLRATYQNLNTWGFQDDLGEVLLTTCESIPHGILMFFSSYAAMNKLLDRWKNNGMWKKLARIKEIYQETRGSGDLSSLMDCYREAIRNTGDRPIGSLTGALLFAVFRGKVAEGIDFSDNEARAVLTVGIPYGVRNDPATDMKFKYNDSNRHKGLLSGSEWYTIQAFRALNQALGRAIRHQNDWGAIILIDERLVEYRNEILLPGWVKAIKAAQTGLNMDLRQLLRGFVARQIKRERQSLLMKQV